MALLMAIYSSSFGNGLDAKRFCRSSFDRVQHTHTHTPVHPVIRMCACVLHYTWKLVGKKTERYLRAGFIRVI